MEDKIQNLYNSLFPEGTMLLDISAKLETMEYHSNIDALRKKYCNELLYAISSGYIYYTTSLFKKDILIKDFLKNVKKLPKKETYYWSLYYFFSLEYEKCMCDIKKFILSWKNEEPAKEVNEFEIVEFFIEPFKNAFDGFWNKIQQLISPICKKDGSHELCKLMLDYYSCKTDDDTVDVLSEYISKYPKITAAKEYLACTYYNLKMWNNVIACFESVEYPVIFGISRQEMSFMLAWSYGKIRDYKNEQKAYEECLKQDEKANNALNNLGYCLYKQKKYVQACKIFKQCLKQKRDLPFSANNYVRTLIALEKIDEAKKFIEKSDYKIEKSLVSKLEGLKNGSFKIKKQIIDNISDEISIVNKKIDIGLKQYQFSNEKLLEDELTMKIESGIPVFGLKLKIYKRYGEYGRQYIIPCGRLDLLCEDTSGNLYIIELKKDSGYDDPYLQTVRYLEWFEKSKKFKNKKVYGIICLSNPDKKLIDNVHSDSRIRLFEYRISYTEI